MRQESRTYVNGNTFHRRTKAMAATSSSITRPSVSVATAIAPLRPKRVCATTSMGRRGLMLKLIAAVPAKGRRQRSNTTE